MIKFSEEYKKISNTTLGINARNLSYIDRSSIRVSNSKIRVKKILSENNIPTPKTISIIKNIDDLDNFNFDNLPTSFVIKPNKGLGGEGIIIIYGKKKKRNDNDEDAWIAPNKEILSLTEIKIHILNILNGYYSINKKNDIAIFEERIINSQFLRENLHIKEGLPDIRILIYRNFPIMAELRIPTIESKGKANLHSGGIGVGIDIASGVTTNAIMRDNYIDTHPDTEQRLSGIRIPYWDKILDLSIQSSIAIHSKFSGVDIALDKENGPLVMEVNARPGLAIQIANKSGLKERLESVSKLKVKNAASAIRVSKEIFGGEIEEEVNEITGKTVLGRETKIKINDLTELYNAKIDTGAYSTSISEDIAEKIGLKDTIDRFNSIENRFDMNISNIYKIRDNIKKEHPEFNITIIKSGNGMSVRLVVDITIHFIDENVSIESKATVEDRGHMKYNLIIGRKDLRNFLIDVTKNT